ncbi:MULTISPECIES: FkbM family methyltransferase [Sphingomonas]|uniref:FkbM family methyltransferase n=1 Tax=Sphingomonas TaxID=13687 RepID=UPI000DEECE37|nr:MULTISPECIES: FkbM family methyltransferase [Sphingomonas]
MSFTSYAQNFEDVLLWRALGHVEHGRYLDVGAQDPEWDSVSMAFYQRGWRGIHVEPTPDYARKLREQRPDEEVVEAAVSMAPGPITLHEIPETGLTTGVRSIADGHVRAGRKARDIQVPTVRLSALLGRADPFHWMKIDVEGMEADVLESWGDHPARPWLAVVEATLPNSREHSDGPWRHQLERRGYREVHFDGLSRYFVHEGKAELAEAFACPPNIFDGFVITAKHFANQRILEELEALERRADATATEVRASEAGLVATRAQLAETKSQQLSLEAERGELQAANARQKEEMAAAVASHRAEQAALNAQLAQAEEQSARRHEAVRFLSDHLETERENAEAIAIGRNVAAGAGQRGGNGGALSQSARHGRGHDFAGPCGARRRLAPAAAAVGHPRCRSFAYARLRRPRHQLSFPSQCAKRSRISSWGSRIIVAQLFRSNR